MLPVLPYIEDLYRERDKVAKDTKQRIGNDDFRHKMCSWFANNLDEMHYWEMYNIIQANQAMEFMITPFPIAQAFARHVRAKYLHILKQGYQVNNHKQVNDLQQEDDDKWTFSLLDPMTGTGCDCWSMFLEFKKHIFIQASNYDSSTVMEEKSLFENIARRIRVITHDIQAEKFDAQLYAIACEQQGELKGKSESLQEVLDVMKEVKVKDQKTPLWRNLYDQIKAKMPTEKQMLEADEKVRNNRKTYEDLHQKDVQESNLVRNLVNDARFAFAQLDVTSIDWDLNQAVPQLPEYTLVYIDPPWPGTFTETPPGEGEKDTKFTWAADPSAYKQRYTDEYRIGSRGELFKFVEKLFQKKKAKIVSVKLCKYALTGMYIRQGIRQLNQKHLQVDYAFFSHVDIYLKDEGATHATKMRRKYNGVVSYLFVYEMNELQKQEWGQRSQGDTKAWTIPASTIQDLNSTKAAWLNSSSTRKTSREQPPKQPPKQPLKGVAMDVGLFFA